MRRKSTTGQRPSIPHYAMRGDARDRSVYPAAMGRDADPRDNNTSGCTALVTHDVSITCILGYHCFFGTVLVHLAQINRPKYVCGGLLGDCVNCQWPECEWQEAVRE